MPLAGNAIAAPAFVSQLSAKDQTAVFAAAGFKLKGGKYVRCEEDPPSASYGAGRIEIADLNHDGNPEAWVTESSTFCYGMTGEAFVLLSRDAKGGWRTLLDGVGVADVKRSQHAGWPDIEIGGPGMGPFPLYRFNGKKYVPA
jgi:hypothetical protein